MRVVIIMIIAIMGALVYIVRLVNVPVPKVSHFKSELSKIMAKGEVKIDLPPLVAEEREKTRAEEWVRNPFSFIQSPALVENLELQAISIDAEGKGLVVIDGEIYREGDVVGIYKIIKINKDYIVVDKGGSNIIVKLKKESEK